MYVYVCVRACARTREKERERERERETERETDRQTDRQTDRGCACVRVHAFSPLLFPLHVSGKLRNPKTSNPYSPV